MQHTYERRIPPPLGPNVRRSLGIERGQDFRRTLDYLESRPDVDRARIAGYGISMGAQLMPVMLAIEPRVRAGVLLSGGFETYEIPAEWDPINFAGRVSQPVIMVNGREDFDLPYDTAQVPLFNMLGTPARTERAPGPRRRAPAAQAGARVQGDPRLARQDLRARAV